MKTVVLPVIRPTSFAKTPVATMPTMPPTPWQGKTSSVSSSADFVRQCTARLLITAGRDADDDAVADADVARGRRDRHQADDGADAGAHAPRACGRAAMSKKIQASIAAAEAVLVVRERQRRRLVGRQRRARVEAEPAEPQHARAEQHERDVGRRVRFASPRDSCGGRAPSRPPAPRSRPTCGRPCRPRSPARPTSAGSPADATSSAPAARR